MSSNPPNLPGSQGEATAIDSTPSGITQIDHTPRNAVPTGTTTAQLVDRFIVCGLGSLGQYCVLNLKRFALKAFEIHVTAIETTVPSEWEVADLPKLLAGELVLGDCRDAEILIRAGIQHCRTILLVTNNDTVNVEAAITARRLNPYVRLVVRLSRPNLSQLLRHQLGNFVAFEPTELPSTAFALAGLGAGILGYFSLGDCQLQVVEETVQSRDFRFDGLLAASLHKKTYRLLSHHPAQGTTQNTAVPNLEQVFYQWRPDQQVKAQDRIAYIEVVGPLPRSLAPQKSSPTAPTTSSSKLPGRRLRGWVQRGLQQKLLAFLDWIQAQQNRRAVGIGLLVAGFLWMLGTILLKTSVEGMTWAKAISNGAVLLLGGYGDVFGGVEVEDVADRIPVWVNFISLCITLTSFLFVLGMFSIVAEGLLSSKFEFLRRRLPIPKQNHVVIVGFGRIGQRVSLLLQQFKQPVVAITEQLDNTKLSAKVPLLVGDPMVELARVNLPTAKSIMLLTDDQMLNLEIALIARDVALQANRNIDLVIRTYNQRFSDNLQQLLPDAKAMAAYALSAEAFAGAAFGENILGLFQLNSSTILVTEYIIAENDTLIDKLLSEVAYGYDVLPILHQKSHQISNTDILDYLMPSDDIKLLVGDRLIILASLQGLRCIEHGELRSPKRWRLEAQKPLNPSSILDAGSILHRISGYSLDEARTFMNQLPNSLELGLYEHQAYRLLQELHRCLPIQLTPLQEPSTPTRDVL